jgi:hypothetical protein
MEPPEGARLEGGWWVFTPAVPPQHELLLAASGATGGGWTLCTGGSCREIGKEAGKPVRLSPCRDQP